MSKDKYLSIFLPQMETIVFFILQIFYATRAVLKIGLYSRISPSFSQATHTSRLIKFSSKETVPCKFVLAKNKNVASEFMNNLALVFRCAMFQDMLNHIVAILILNQSFSVLVKFIQYLRCLFWHAVFKDALDDTAPIRMS